MNAFAGLHLALQQLRRVSRLKNGEIAQRAEISPGMLSGYMTGRENPTADTLGRVLEAMGATVEDLAAELGKVQGRRGKDKEPSDDVIKERLVQRFGEVVEELFEVVGGQRRGEGQSVERAAFDALDRIGDPKRRVRKRKET
ncbi:MAG TPA: helix-turn-helix transcriptional regulator [Thermoanaerobaculia bacterium]|jgi:transcriptional regulator with XRE-family HTH domain|nr:helix-turn-helix transcriptional regulator [Thermoanaerobaculia bacterium]